MDVDIYQVLGLGQAEMIVGLLKSYEISATKSYESAGLAIGIPIAPLGMVHILVSESDEKAAREILAALDRGDMADTSIGGDSQDTSEDDEDQTNEEG